MRINWLPKGWQKLWKELCLILGPDSIWSVGEKVRFVLMSVGVVILFAWFFYRRLYMSVILWPIGIGSLISSYRTSEAARQRKLRKEFQEFLNAMQMNLRTGYAAENALRESYEELRQLYGEDAIILPSLRRALFELSNRMPMDQVLQRFGEKINLEEAAEFANVFSIAKKSGARLGDVVRETADLITEKMETEDEIQISIASKDLERRMMNIIPFLIILYIGITSPGYFTVLYTSGTGSLVMTLCMLLYLAAVYLGRRIIWIAW